MKMGMKTTLLTSILAAGLLTGTAFAQTGTTANQQQMRGNMQGSGMMGGGMMGGGMMNGGMMGGGMMGGNMMSGQGNNWGMGCNGMMGGAMMSQMSPGQRQEFMNQTTDLRQKMMDKRFAYMETMRNPDATPQDLAKIEKEMLDLRSQMMDKMNKLQGK